MPTSAHPISQEELMSYLDGQLSPERAAAAVAHLEHCRTCQDLAADLQSVSRRLQQWQIDQPNLTAPQLITSNPAQAFQSRFFFGRSPWIWATASVFVIAALIPFIGKYQRRVVHLEEYAELEQQTAAGSGVISGLAATQGHMMAPAPRAQAPMKQSVSTNGPLIIRTAQLSLTVANLDAARRDVDKLLTGYRGYIAQMNVNSPSGQGRSLDASLRVPVAQLDAMLSAMKRLGHVDSEGQNGEEVTSQVVDLDARLSNARNAEQRLTELLRDRSGKLSDVLAVEEQIDNVRGQIEQMEAERKSFSNRIDFATVQLRIVEEYKQSLVVDDRSLSTRLRNAAIDGYRTVVAGVIGIVLFLLAYGPAVLIAAAILFFPVRAFWRRRNQITG